MQSPPTIDPDRHALFLDFDGTLVGFVDDPSAVAIDPSALDDLLRLQRRLEGALAVVSGRRIADLDRFLAPLRFAAAGVHGLEMRNGPDDATESTAEPEALARVRAALEAAVEGAPGLRLEDKGTALVLHYRGHAELEGLALEAMDAATREETGLKVMQGHSIVEVHPAGMDKGIAVAALLAQPPFAGRVPIYVGDDTTDEYAMAAVQAAGGLGVKVGPGDSVALARLADVASVHHWLAGGPGDGA